MTAGQIPRQLIATAMALVFSLAAVADLPPRIGEPGYTDTQYMEAQRSSMDDLVRRNFGSQFNGNKHHDLALLQRTLDSGLVRADQTLLLQAMGVIMGDLLAADLDMHWVIYEDNIGRSRALRYRQSEEYLFPITMISRRREVDNQTPVTDIYQKAYNLIDAVKPPLPFH
jgi:hypothetical protein